MREWVRRQVTEWPAPIPIGSNPPSICPDVLTFTPARPPGHGAIRYHYELHSDGSALGALQIGSLRDSSADGRQVWALGEGAMAWITIAMLRLNAAFARHVSVLGEAEVHVTVVCPAGPGPTAPMQVWNHAHAVYGPAGNYRSGDVSANRTVDLAACLSYFLPTQARPLLVDLLQPFEVVEPRHISPDGVIRRRHFTGHDELIHTWAKSIGVPSEL
ncbi:hypothetical protein [Streptomyces niveus]|uniref:hypothetical protein n=1 Tax=Streptomyces niveus TaxID=193462 RepID=UPI00363F9C6E